MDTNRRNEIETRESQQGRKTTRIILSVLAAVAVLTWAVSTLFEIALVKSLAAVIMVSFVVVVALLMAGIT